MEDRIETKSDLTYLNNKQPYSNGLKNIYNPLQPPTIQNEPTTA